MKVEHLPPRYSAGVCHQCESRTLTQLECVTNVKVGTLTLLECVTNVKVGTVILLCVINVKVGTFNLLECVTPM